MNDSVELPNETCDECVFDASRWSRTDAIRTMDHAADLAGLAIAGLPDELWNRRPDEVTWSIAEYLDHLAEIFQLNRLAAELATVLPDSTIGVGTVPFAAEPPPLEREPVLAMLARRGHEAATLFGELDGDDDEKAVIIEGLRWTVGYAATHVCHDLMHHLMDIARLRGRLGDGIEPMTGTLASVHASDGGVPKRAVESAEIDVGGVVGDRQAARRHHGRPWQALCLYSTDVVDRLAAEGHPIVAGAAGENLSLSGIDWGALRAGLTVTIGDMTCRLSAPAVPCAKNNQWFSDGDSSHLSHYLHPGQSRWYANVLTPGAVARGDQVTVR